MRCNKAGILISSYVDNELDKIQVRKLESHLERCAKCRARLEEINQYKKLAGRIEDIPAPEGFAGEVWSKLGYASGKNSTGRYPGNKNSRAIFWAAASIAAILIAITIIPFDAWRPNTIKADFYNEVKKGGKGPASGSTIAKVKKGKGSSENPKIKIIEELVSKHKGSIKDTVVESVSGRISRMTIEIPPSRIDSFREDYNKLQPGNPLPGLKGKTGRKMIILSIGFPDREFFPGDYNNDGYSDLLILFTGIGEKPSWYLSENTGTGDFKNPVKVYFPDNPQYEKSGCYIVSGDFNGDKFCDIARVSLNPGTASISVYQNHKGKAFNAPAESTLNGVPREEGKKITLLSGDINGDGIDDLVLHQKYENREGRWYWSSGGKSYSFSPFSLLASEHDGWGNSDYAVFLADINGDGLDDTGIYGQSGERDAYWHISLNEGGQKFAKPIMLIFGNSPRAFQGNYTIFSCELNGDNYDDLLVKYAGSDDYSYWFKLVNESAGKFSHGFPVDTGGRKDFSLSGN